MRRCRGRDGRRRDEHAPFSSVHSTATAAAMATDGDVAAAAGEAPDGIDDVSNTPVVPRRTVSSPVSFAFTPPKSSVSGWLRSRLGRAESVQHGDGPGSTGMATATATAGGVSERGGGVRFDVPPSPASTVGAMLGEMLQEDNEVLFRHGLFNAVGNAILLLLVALLYCVWKLLEDFRSPMLWALLVSLALRDVKTKLVRFWTEMLERHTLLGLALAPLGMCWRLAASAMKRVESLMGLDPGEIRTASSGTRTVATPRGIHAAAAAAAVDAALSPRGRSRLNPSAHDPRLRTAAPTTTKNTAGAAPSSASTFHFRWLVTAGLCLEGWSLLSRDWVLTRSIAALTAVAALVVASTVALIALTNWYLFTREGSYGKAARGQEQHQEKKQKQQGRREVSTGPGEGGHTSGDAPSESGWLVTCRDVYTGGDLAVRRALVSSLHFVVAVTLITGGIILVVVIAAFFTVNIAQESSSAVAAAHQSVMAGSRSSEGALAAAVEAGTAVWEDAVERHWPAALAWAESHVNDVFPGANATELWVSMQHIYAQIAEAMGEDTTAMSDGRGKVRGKGDGGGTKRWAIVLKEAGSMLSTGDVTGAFSHLSELSVMGGGDAGVGAAGGSHVNHIPGAESLLRVLTTAREALQARAAVIARGAGGGLATVTAWAARASFSVFGVAGGIVNFILKSVVFLTVLFHILSSKVDPAVRLVELIPVNDKIKDVAVASLTRGVRGVFVSCMKLAIFHAAFTWVTFRAFGVHFVYTSTLASGATAILPLLASWSVSLPAALGLLAKGEGIKGAALVVMHWVTLVFVDIDIYQSEIQVVHPYIVGLSVVGGMCVFDPALQGAVLGPLLVTALATGYNLYQELMRTPPPAGTLVGATPATARAAVLTATARRRAAAAKTPGQT